MVVMSMEGDRRFARYVYPYRRRLRELYLVWPARNGRFVPTLDTKRVLIRFILSFRLHA